MTYKKTLMIFALAAVIAGVSPAVQQAFARKNPCRRSSPTRMNSRRWKNRGKGKRKRLKEIQDVQENRDRLSRELQQEEVQKRAEKARLKAEEKKRKIQAAQAKKEKNCRKKCRTCRRNSRTRKCRKETKKRA